MLPWWRRPPIRQIIDTDHPSFHNLADMPATITAWLQGRGQIGPAGVGPITRAIYDRLALNYRPAVESLDRVGGRRIEEINLVGEGVRAKALGAGDRRRPWR
jgi:sugar (pentulose or hexulose) kinase